MRVRRATAPTGAAEGEPCTSGPGTGSDATCAQHAPHDVPTTPTSRARGRKTFIGLLLAAATVAVALVLPAVASANSPSWVSDKADYHPTEVAHLSGLGYTGGTSYSVPVMRPDGSIVVIDPATDLPLGPSPMWDHASSDSAGNLTYDYQLDGIEGLYTARVYPGNWDGNWLDTPISETTFTDAAIPNSASMTTWQTKNGGGWIQGTLNANNSDYKEGETIPFRIELGTLATSGNPYTANICRDFRDTNTLIYGYTTLKPFDTSRAAAPGGSISDTFGPFSGVNMDITGVNETGGPGACGVGQRLTIVTFDVNAAGPQYLLWGGRLAAPGDTDVTPNVAFGKSASFYPGGSLQMRLESPDKTAGINPSGIIQLAAITVTKVVDSGTATPDQWCFNINPAAANGSQQCVPTGQSSVQFFGLNTGNYTVTETSVANYHFALGSGINCTFSASTATASVTAAAGGATNASCTFHNARDTAKLELRKTLSPSNDPGKFDLFAKQSNVTQLSASNVGDGGTSGAGGTTLNTGSYDLSEAAHTGTNLGDYTSTLACKNRSDNSTVTVTSGSVALLNNADVICTWTNTRKGGTLTVVKSLSPANDPGLFNLQVDGTTAGTGANVGNGGTTGPQSVTPGTHTVGETAGTSTALGNYTSSISCSNGASGSNSGPLNVSINSNDNVTCTITNTRNTAKLELRKTLSPSNDPGKFDLFAKQSNVTKLSALNVGDGGTSGAGGTTLNTGSYDLSEAAHTGTNLGDYTSTLACKNRSDNSTVTVTSGSVALLNTADVICTWTNTRNNGTLTVVKSLSPSGDPGLFNLQVDGSTAGTGANVGDGGTTGPQSVTPGTHTVGETAGTSTSLGNYTSSISCSNGASSSDSGPLNVSINSNDNVTCTITNKRKPQVKVIKSVVSRHSDTGKFNLQVNGTTQAPNVGDGGNTGSVNVAVGSNPTVGETAGTDHLAVRLRGLDLLHRRLERELRDAGPLSARHPDRRRAVTCTITNKRKPQVKVIKSLLPRHRHGQVQPAGQRHDQAPNVGDGGNTGFVNVAVGSTRPWARPPGPPPRCPTTRPRSPAPVTRARAQ